MAPRLAWVVLAVATCGALTGSGRHTPDPVGPAAGTSERTGVVQGEQCAAGEVREATGAVGGRYAFRDSTAPLVCSLVLSGPSDVLVVRLHGDGDLRFAVGVDDRLVRNGTSTATSFEDVVLAGSWTAGRHTVTVEPLDAATQNLHLDQVEARSGETVVDTAYTTAYTWFDNTPPGSAAISHPVVHRTAGGRGTYEDPVTLAVGHDLSSGRDVLDLPAGTVVYLPDVRRYAVVEDTCGDGPAPQDGPCHQGHDVFGTGSSVWVDLWLGGAGGSREAVVDCASTVTDGSGALHRLVLHPRPDYVVAPGDGVFHDGRCDAAHGNTLRLTSP